MVQRNQGRRYRDRELPGPLPAHEREPDVHLLCEGELGPFVKGDAVKKSPSWAQVHPDLQEILVRMDEKEVASLQQALGILMRLEKAEIARVKAILKVVNIVVGIWKVIKWSIASFLGGLAAVALAGDQLLKIWSWITKLFPMITRFIG